jgi:hypothetical protein
VPAAEWPTISKIERFGHGHAVRGGLQRFLGITYRPNEYRYHLGLIQVKEIPAAEVFLYGDVGLLSEAGRVAHRWLFRREQRCLASDKRERGVAVYHDLGKCDAASIGESEQANVPSVGANPSV